MYNNLGRRKIRKEIGKKGKNEPVNFTVTRVTWPGLLIRYSPTMPSEKFPDFYLGNANFRNSGPIFTPFPDFYHFCPACPGLFASEFSLNIGWDMIRPVHVGGGVVVVAAAVLHPTQIMMISS
jgi:hypothetical protein